MKKIAFVFLLTLASVHTSSVTWAADAAEIALYLNNGKQEKVRGNYAAAMQWYQKAAAEGDAEGLYQVGDFHAYGRGVPNDAAKALEWWRKAAEKNHAQSQYNIAVMYWSGLVVPKDDVKAREWYLKSAIQGYAEAEYSVAAMYLGGVGGPVDVAEGYRWLRKSAADGYALAKKHDAIFQRIANAIAAGDIAAQMALLEELRASLNSNSAK